MTSALERWSDEITDAEHAEHLAAVHDQATAAPGEAPAPPLEGLDLRRLDAPLPPPDFLVTGRIVRRTLTLLGAKPGLGKSWLGEDLALALALGRPWLGHPVPQPVRVLYLDAENGDDLALTRLKQLGGRSTDLQGRLLYSTEPLLLSRHLDLRRLAATLTSHRPELVVIDTLASHAPGAEADTEASATFLSNVWHLCRDHGAAVLLMHHLRKSQQQAGRDDPLDAFRGAGHLVGAAHRAWVLDPLTPSQPHFLLRDVKARGFASCPPVRVRVTDDPDTGTTQLEVQGVERVVENGYDATLTAALTFIDGHHGRAVRTADLVHALVTDDLSERSLKDYLTRAVSAGVLHKPARGQYLRAQPALTDDDAPEEQTA